MKELYLNYLKDAKRLFERIHILKETRRCCFDVNEIKKLTARIDLLTTERLELLRDSKDIAKYLTDDELLEIAQIYRGNAC